MILEREASNKTISYLKLLTFIILAISSSAYAIQYSLVLKMETDVLVLTEKLREINELQAQMISLKGYATYFSIYLPTPPELGEFIAEINELDSYLDNYEFNYNAKIVYRDLSSDNYYLGFGLNKLVSEANSLKSTTSLFNSNSNNVFFLKYNTVNGLHEGI